MDVLASLLDGPRGRDPFLFRMIMQPPWSVRIADEAPVGMIALLRGAAWVIPEAGEPVRIGAGAVAVVKGPDPVTVADDPATPPQLVIHPGRRRTTPHGAALDGSAMDLGVRTWGNHPDGSTLALIGCYQTGGEISRRLLDALPTVLVLTPPTWNTPLLALLETEIAKPDPGQQAVLDLLFDLLLIAAIRAWLTQPHAHPPAWYHAHHDPVADPHDQLDHRRLRSIKR